MFCQRQPSSALPWRTGLVFVCGED